MPGIPPPARQQFFDLNGDPLRDGFVHFYEPSSSTPKDTWTTRQRTATNSNPVQLDGDGMADIWGVGPYRQVLTDSAAVQIWDKETTVWPDDVALLESCTCGGTKNALTATPTTNIQPVGAQAYINYQTIAVVASLNNDGATSLNYNGFGNKPVYKDESAGPVALAGGEIFAGDLYLFTYDLALNSGGGGWHMGGPGMGAWLYALVQTVSGNITSLQTALTALTARVAALEALELSTGGASGSGQVNSWAWIDHPIAAGHGGPTTVTILWGSVSNLTAAQDLAVTLPFSFASAGWIMGSTATGTNAATHAPRIWSKAAGGFTISNDGANTIGVEFMLIGVRVP